MKKTGLLAIGNDAELRGGLLAGFDRENYTVTCCSTGDEAVEAAKRAEHDVCIIDISAPGIVGADLFIKLREIQPTIEAVVLTDESGRTNAIDAIKLGAYDYLTKPCKPDDLELICRNASEKKRLAEENSRLRNRLKLDTRDYRIAGESDNSVNLRKLVEKASRTMVPVLIRGEAGSGKKFTARAIHTLCFSKDAPFITVDCRTENRDELENILFGRSPDTAVSWPDGSGSLIDAAQGGMLYLDNIEELTQSTEIKLCRFLETGEYQHIGSDSVIRADVRIVAATRHDLRDWVTKKEFREDLFYQISVITINVPSLRERKEDIPLLIDQIAEEFAGGEDAKFFSKKAVTAVLKYDWPGNIRELKNVVERALLITKKHVVQIKEIPITVSKSSVTNKLRQLMSISEIEKEHILYVLNAADGNISRASRILGVSRPKLYRKIEQYKSGEI